MLTVLYYILRSLSQASTRLSEYIKNKLEHKHLCKQIWKNRKQIVTYENEHALAIIIKNSTTPDEFLTKLEQLFNQNSDLKLESLSSSSFVLADSKSKENNIPPETNSSFTQLNPTIDEHTTDKGISNQFTPYIIPNGNFEIREINITDGIESNSTLNTLANSIKTTALSQNFASTNLSISPASFDIQPAAPKPVSISEQISITQPLPVPDYLATSEPLYTPEELISTEETKEPPKEIPHPPKLSAAVNTTYKNRNSRYKNNYRQ